MYSLVFDTCFNKTYICLAKDDDIIESQIIQSTDFNYHSVFLIPKIKDILVKNNILIKDIGVIGVNIGPGSFTGIRAGITVARVLCQQFNIKLVGVSSLNILSKLENSDCVVTLDARKNKVYFAKYKEGLEIIRPCLIDKDSLIEKVNNCVIVADSSLYKYYTENNINAVNFEEINVDLGIYLSQIVSEKIKIAGEDYNWAKVKPLYIQPPSITKPKVNINV